MNDGFNQFNLPAALLETLETMGYTAPTQIQAEAIPAARAGRDVLGSAQTGTGKTGAFCIPMIAALIEDPTKYALVMTPTRELATQVLDVARTMIGKNKKGRDSFMYTAQLIGGESMGKQFSQLRMNPRLIVGTPGRINDHLRQNPKLLANFSLLVLDEADRMLDMGFSVQIDEVLSKMAQDRQTLMFSATFPPSIVRFSQNYLKNPERVSVGEQSRAHENIDHAMIEVSNDNKYAELLTQLETREGTVIVFVKTKHGADKMADRLTKSGHEATALHGGLRQGQRDRAIANFRKQHYRVLVATDVAARGLDVPHVEHVINYDMPQVAEDYIHRIGRTARAGAKGAALAMVVPADKHLWRDVARLLDPTMETPDESSQERQFKGKGGKKKPFGRKPYGEKSSDGGRFERKSFGDKKFGEKKFGAERRFSEKDGEKKPFKFNKFKKAEGGNDNFDNRQSESFKKPFKKREEGEFQKREDGFKPRDGFKKPFKKREDGEFQKRDDGAQSRDGFKKPFKKREDGFKSEGGFKKPFKKREDGAFNKEDGFKKREGGFKSRDGVKKDAPFKKKEGGFAKKEGGFKKTTGNLGKKKPGGFKPRSRAA